MNLSQLPDEPYELADLKALAKEQDGILPPHAVFWLLVEYENRQREVSALISECADRTEESEHLKSQLEVCRLRIRQLTKEAGVDRERERLEMAARSVC